MVNYQGGFVRRGLAGQIFYWLFSGSHHNVGLKVMTIDATILALLALCVSYLVLGTKNSWVSWIVLSPVAVAFSTYDTPGGFRKDNLLLLALAVAALAARTTARVARLWLGLSLVLFVVVLFSWEPAAFSLPVLWWICGRAPLSTQVIRKWRLTFVSVGVLGFALASLFHGSIAQTNAICHSVVTSGMATPQICSGAMASIADSASAELSFVGAEYPKYLWYIPWYLLTLVPFYFSGWLRRYRKTAGAVVASNLLLFVAGTDYGRWINILAVSLALVWLTSPERDLVGAKVSWRERVAMVAFVTLWSAPWSGNPRLWRGFADML